METKLFCQSCGMPLEDKKLIGTEANGNLNQEQCIYCYKDGKYTYPDMTMVQMQGLVKEKMQEMNLPEDLIQQSVDNIPNLKRWNN